MDMESTMTAQGARDFLKLQLDKQKELNEALTNADVARLKQEIDAAIVKACLERYCEARTLYHDSRKDVIERVISIYTDLDFKITHTAYPDNRTMFLISWK